MAHATGFLPFFDLRRPALSQDGGVKRCSQEGVGHSGGGGSAHPSHCTAAFLLAAREPKRASAMAKRTASCTMTVVGDMAPRDAWLFLVPIATVVGGSIRPAADESGVVLVSGAALADGEALATRGALSIVQASALTVHFAVAIRDEDASRHHDGKTHTLVDR